MRVVILALLQKQKIITQFSVRSGEQWKSSGNIYPEALSNKLKESKCQREFTYLFLLV
jgi:hypothetical protein